MSKEKQEIAKKVTSELEAIGEMEELEKLIKDNVIEFEVKDKIYRVRKPTSRERGYANKEKLKKYHEMLHDDIYMLKDQLLELYEKKGISISDMDSKLIALQKQENNLLLRLAKITDKPTIKKLSNEVIGLREDKFELMTKKNELLEVCIEQQISDFLQSYVLYLVLEIKEGDNWKRLFNNYDNFLDTKEEELIVKSAYHFSVLFYNNAI